MTEVDLETLENTESAQRSRLADGTNLAREQAAPQAPL
jgi:hypothetical protein